MCLPCSRRRHIVTQTYGKNDVAHVVQSKLHLVDGYYSRETKRKSRRREIVIEKYNVRRLPEPPKVPAEVQHRSVADLQCKLPVNAQERKKISKR